MSILDKVAIIKSFITTVDKVLHVIIQCIDYVLGIKDVK